MPRLNQTTILRQTILPRVDIDGSLSFSEEGVSLSNDSDLPGVNKVYGTNSNGEKGWKDDLTNLSQILTDSATIVWDYSLGNIATVTMAGSRLLSIVSAPAHSFGQLIVSRSGDYTLTLPSGSVAADNQVTLGTYTKKDVLTFYYDGTNYYWRVLNNVDTVLDTSVQAWLDAGTTASYTLPSVTVQEALSDFVSTLKSASVNLWTRTKLCYVMFAGEVRMATLNLKDPAVKTSTLVNSPTYTDLVGIKSNGTNSYIRVPFKTDEYSGIESDLTTVVYVAGSSTTPLENIGVYGARIDAASRFEILAPLSVGLQGYRRQFGATDQYFTSNNHKGLYVKTYDGVNGVIYKDGVKTSVATTPLAPTISIDEFILSVNNASVSGGATPAGYYTHPVSIFMHLDRVSDTDELNLRTAFNTLKTAVGLP